MDTGSARPPLPSYTAITPVTRAPDRNEPATKTDLPASRAVNPAAESSNSRQATEHESKHEKMLDKLQPQLERKNIVDAESKSVIFVATNSDTGEVVRQVPSETLRRLRAYAQSTSEQQAVPAEKHIERTA